jgi:hypothetical protein
MGSTFNEGMLDYAVKIGTIFKNNPEEVTCCLGFKSVVESLNESYQILVRKKEITPIEALPKEEKARLWNIAKGYEVSEEHRINICRSVYVLEEITK